MRLATLFSIALAFSFVGSAEAQQTMDEINPNLGPAMKIDQQRVAANGLRTIEGKHLTIYTDVPPDEMVEELTDIFDAAVPQWCDYFGVDVSETTNWKMKVFLIREKSRFEKAGLIPDDLAQFPAGINRGHEIWFFVQPDAYYTRHLLLHEGTHAFMQWFGNGLGAPWYAEGMAELLGLHRWADGKLNINHRVAAPIESEGWGRPKLIKDWVAANREGKRDKPLRDVLTTPNRAFGDVENYAWCWAACEFLSQHPVSKVRFAELQKAVHRLPEKFNEEFYRLFGDDLDLLERDWAWYIRELDYGYSVERGYFRELRRGDKEDRYELKTDRSWQYLNMRVKAGQKFQITPTGRFEIGSSEVNGTLKPWPSESGGITIDYYRGRPIGELHVTILPTDSTQPMLPRLCQQTPMPVGFGKVITADVDGLLCFRINESPAKLADNRGVLELAIEKMD